VVVLPLASVWVTGLAQKRKLAGVQL
jgi:hypothetical protein